MNTRNLIVKVIIGLSAIVVVGLLFAKTLRDVTAEPYIIRQIDLRNWSIELSTQMNTESSLLSLRAPQELSMILFDQIFQRTMASLTRPAVSAIALILKDEFETVMSTIVSPEELLTLARSAGLEDAILEPVCMSVYRTPEGREQQIFFMLFKFPQFDLFREQVADLLFSRSGE